MLFPVNIIKYNSINHLKINEFNYLEISKSPLKLRKQGLQKPSIIVVDRKILPEKAILYTEFFIHKHLDHAREELEFREKQKINLIEQVTINNSMANLSYTMLIKYITLKGENPEGEVIINVFNKSNVVIFSLI